jgi:rRNA-processing protein FCF1
MGKPSAAERSGGAHDLRVLVDTSSWMHPLVEQVLEHHFVPLLNQVGQKFVVPQQVVEELRKHLNAPVLSTKHEARRALDLIERLQAMGLADIFGGSEETFADNVVQLVMVRFCEKYRFCLLTQDRALATDALRLGKRRSIERAKEITAFRVGDQGSLDRWELPGPQGDAVWREVAPPPVRAASAPPTTPSPPKPKFRLCTGAPRNDDRTIPITKVPRVGDFVRDAAGRSMRLTTVLGSGGEGSVFGTDCGLVCKVYDERRLTVGLRNKLDLMLSKPVQHPAICWPASLATNERGELVGYLMPAAQGKELQRTIFIKPLLQSTFPHWTRRELVMLALAALQPILELHERNVLLGDINPRNILVGDERHVFFVDTDSYQLEDFACPVGTATFLTPDLLGKNLATVLRNFSHEFFAVATLVFMLLMPGKPPYSHAGGEDPAENVRRRHFPYGIAEKKGKGVPDGPWRFMWSHLPFYLKEAFHGVFADGETLTTDEWVTLLGRYQSDLARGHVSDEIYPTTFKRLRREDVLRKGGAWLPCKGCGAGYGSFDRDTNGQLCPDCRNREVTCACFLCNRDFSMRLVQREQLEGRKPICHECRAHKQTAACKNCGQPFEITAADRAYFKQKNLSLPRRCKNCRQALRAARGPAVPQSHAIPELDPEAALTDDDAIWNRLRRLFWT